VPYPAVLLAVGINDSRVSPWESAKFGARLAAATRSERPVWFLVSDDQGHFSGSLNAKAVELADTFTFIETQLNPPR
jgi:prolyl oligopeptidase